jgi:hypothetical protein
MDAPYPESTPKLLGRVSECLEAGGPQYPSFEMLRLASALLVGEMLAMQPGHADLQVVYNLLDRVDELQPGTDGRGGIPQDR